MKILFICIGKLDIKNWSGTTYKIYEKLKTDVDIRVIELDYKNWLVELIYKIYNRINENIKNE